MSLWLFAVVAACFPTNVPSLQQSLEADPNPLLLLEEHGLPGAYLYAPLPETWLIPPFLYFLSMLEAQLDQFLGNTEVQEIPVSGHPKTI